MKRATTNAGFNRLLKFRSGIGRVELRAFYLTDELLDCLVGCIGQFVKLDSLPFFLDPHYRSMCIDRNSGARQSKGYAHLLPRFEVPGFNLNSALAEVPGSPFSNFGSHGARCFRL